MTLTELADRLGCRLEGDGQLDVRRVTGLEDAQPGDLSFFANPKYAAALKTTRATAVIAHEDTDAAPCAVLRTKNPYLAFARAVALFAERWRPLPGVHSTAFVGAGAAIDPDASIGPMAVIESNARVGARTIIHANVTVGRSAQIGTDCIIHAGVSIRERVQLGDRVVIQDGVVIGSDGFGFARDESGRHVKIPQVGGVVIEDDVEIGANSTIDRPAVGETRIKAGTKIDNLVQVAHGVTLGRDVLLAAQVGIAGSTTLEDRVTLGGQVGVGGHITLGKGSIVSGQTGVSTSIEPGSFMSGYPAIPNRDWLKANVMFRRLPELRKTIADLEARIAELEARLGS